MSIRGVLLDLDGTIYVGSTPVAGAADAISRLREAGFALRFTTNTTRRPVRALAATLSGMGIEVEAPEILTAPRAAARWLRAEGLLRVHPVLLEDTWEDLAGLELVDERADVVLVGDLATEWDRSRLDVALRLLLDGARLVAVQKNRYGHGEAGLEVDAGAFVAALEYSANVESIVVGKPNPAFFRAASDDLGLPPDAVIAIGDDLRTDVAGARAAGLGCVLVRTGKYRPSDEEDPSIRADAVLDSVAGLPDWLASA